MVNCEFKARANLAEIPAIHAKFLALLPSKLKALPDSGKILQRPGQRMGGGGRKIFGNTAQVCLISHFSAANTFRQLSLIALCVCVCRCGWMSLVGCECVGNSPMRIGRLPTFL